ncbi:hypothetical protein MiSe_60290 [Microseira wollei NIES-4236]|uniref:Uncharacterized protein n=1 Tax=Microseira wollei NIES-4236 TaxID=2530354 RepID=A0AAV3XNR5_9CYAN|nr:hypothetical protein MiSe_60290 [Microseira wollei NIES-4236]
MTCRDKASVIFVVSAKFFGCRVPATILYCTPLKTTAKKVKDLEKNKKQDNSGKSAQLLQVLGKCRDQHPIPDYKQINFIIQINDM